MDVSKESMPGQETNETWVIAWFKGVIQGQFAICLCLEKKISAIWCLLLKPGEERMTDGNTVSKV